MTLIPADSAAGLETISVVIPAYNEESRLGLTLERVLAWFEATGREGEILVVDDGSGDGTVALAASFASRAKAIPVQVLASPKNQGKGASVRRGVLASTKDVVLFTDADLSTPIEDAHLLVAALAQGHDVAIGSRALAASRVEVHQPWYREIMGKIFNLLVRLLSGLDLHDTQCGFKAFRGEVGRALFADLTIAGFGFDVEVLFLARRRGYRTKEVGVTWRNSPNSRVHPIKDSARMLRDLVRVRWQALSGAYDRKR